MITIFFAGQARVGKTTAADIVAKYAKKNDFKPVLLSFAKSIKDAATAANLTKEANPIEYRAFCQSIGEGKRKEDPDYWIKKFKEQWLELYEKDNKASQCLDKLWKETIVIVDDCRYLNELNLGKQLGAKTVFISKGTRDLAENRAEWRSHESEDMANQYELGSKDYQDLFHYVIKNDDTLDSFKEKIQNRLLLWLDISPQSYTECNCLACDKMRKDEKITLEEFFKDIFDENEEED